MKYEFAIHDRAGREQVKDFVGLLNHERPWLVTIEPFKKRRTLSQNALYWKWINETVELVADHTGMDNDEIHEFFKKKFLPAKVVEIDGETIDFRSTRKLNTAEMSEYMEKIYAFVSDRLGMRLPLPEGSGYGK